MQSATFTEFRNNAKHYFDRVETGETVEIYRHGRPVALLMPINKSGRSRSRFFETKPLKIPGVSLADALLTEREEK
jgi:prevent-host-death family protein